MKIGRFATTAMAIMPHTDVDEALSLALSLDVPFWPQLPHLGFREDMYVQSLAGFPGVVIDEAEQRIGFEKGRFIAELDGFLARQDEREQVGGALEPADITRVGVTSAAFEPFLAMDLGSYPAIRGQVMGPISCGFRLIDQDKKPVIYDDEVRPLLLEFVAREANSQIALLRRHNPNVFVFMDEPGLGMVFSGMSGYTDARAGEDLRTALGAIHGDVAIHLCGQPDWDFLLRLPIAELSFNAFASGKTFVTRSESVAAFLAREGTLCWGIVPTHEVMLQKVSAEFLADQLSELLQALIAGGVDRELLLDRSMLAPATCNLGGTARSVELAFSMLVELSTEMKRRFA